MMEYVRTGMILLTENYEACVRFYRDVLDLPIMFSLDRSDSRLTCFRFGGSYLMVEPGGKASPAMKTVSESPARIRLNVANIDMAIRELQAKSVNLDRRDFSWGSIADFVDPDGNRCSLRSESGFGL
jgi:lactoylglutathione lyase